MSETFGRQWSTLTTLCKNNPVAFSAITKLYSEVNFPFKIRSTFAQWIEAQPWDEIESNIEYGGLQKAQNLYKELLMKLEEVYKSTSSCTPSFELDKTIEWQQAIQHFKKYFDGNYGVFVNVIRSCLQREQDLITFYITSNSELKRKDPNNPNARPDSPEDLELKNKINALLEEIMSTEQQCQSVSAQQGEFLALYSDYFEKIENLKKENNAPDVSKMISDMKTYLDSEIGSNQGRRTSLIGTYMEMTNKLSEVFDEVWRRILAWQKDQKKSIANLVMPRQGALDAVDKLCEGASSILLKLIVQLEAMLSIVRAVPYENDTSAEEIEKKLEDLKKNTLREHLNRILVVEKNISDRVLKVSSGKSLGFNMVVRLLGANSLSIGSNPPRVRISLYEEKTLREKRFQESGPPPETDDSCCQIVNGTDKTLTLIRGTTSYVAQFQSLSLKNVKRPEKTKNDELLVTEHKYAFVFYTALQLFSETYYIKTISLPVILTSQTSQEIMAKGTLIWDAAFSEDERQPFEYKDEVPWKEFAEVLIQLFENNTGRSLQKEHLSYLAAMALRKNNSRNSPDNGINYDDPKVTITEKLAIRDKLKGKEFSFWKWTMACMNLVKLHVNNEWKDGRIYGFISKENAKRTLMDSSIGTFLLRFSETNIEDSQKADISGYLTLAVVELDPTSGRKKLFHVKEYLSPKEIQEKGLSPILDAMEVADYANPGQKKHLLRHLWPDINKSFYECFEKYISNREKEDDGYKRGRFTIEIFLGDDCAAGPRRRTDSSCTDLVSNPPSVLSSHQSVGSPCPSDATGLSESAAALMLQSPAASAAASEAQADTTAEYHTTRAKIPRMAQQQQQQPSIILLQSIPHSLQSQQVATVRPQQLQQQMNQQPQQQQQQCMQIQHVVYQQLSPQQQYNNTYQQLMSQLQLQQLQQGHQQQVQQQAVQQLWDTDNLVEGGVLLRDANVGVESSGMEQVLDDMYRAVDTGDLIPDFDTIFTNDEDGDLLLRPDM